MEGMKRYTTEQKRQAMQLWAAEGVSYREVSRRTQIPLDTVLRWARQDDPQPWAACRGTIHAQTVQKLVTRISTDLAEMQLRHLTLARGLQTKALQGLGHLQPEAMTPRDVGQLAERGITLERLAVGEATERPEDGLARLADLVERWHQQGGR